MPNVTVTTPAVIQVKVNSQQSSEVRSLNYGIRTLKGSTDLSLNNVQDDDVIVYQANTDSFVVKSVIRVNGNLDEGFF
jgi:hypothetical protein